MCVCVVSYYVGAAAAVRQLSLMEMEPAAMAVLFDFFNAIFAAELPILYEHFESIGMIPQLYLIEWLYTLFAKPLPQCV